MSSMDNLKAGAGQSGGAGPQQCLVCGDPVAEVCFCRIPREDGSPIMLCCPDCAMQYFASSEDADTTKQEFLNYENGIHFFVGENKPWS